MRVSLTVGKVDAGVAVLLTDDKRLIEFPSILLPPDITSGSIVDVNVSRNLPAEATAQKAFASLQSTLLSTFGSATPSPPVLRCRNATQTSVVLEWNPIELASADLRSLSLYRNGSKAGAIPRPKDMTSTKISGLAVDSPYTFHLVLKTSAGTYTSEKLNIRTHKMTDLTGIVISPGSMASELRESLESTAERMGAKIIETVRIDTTHFVCTEGEGPGWRKAMEMNIPVVTPDWVKGCEQEGRLVNVRGYYLNADPKLRQVGQGQPPLNRQQSKDSVQSPGYWPRPGVPPRQDSALSQRTVGTPRTEVTPPTPERVRVEEPEPDEWPRPTRTENVEKSPEHDAGGNNDEEDDNEDEEEDTIDSAPRLEAEPQSKEPTTNGRSKVPETKAQGSDGDEDGQDDGDEQEGFDEVKL